MFPSFSLRQGRLALDAPGSVLPRTHVHLLRHLRLHDVDGAEPRGYGAADDGTFTLPSGRGEMRLGEVVLFAVDEAGAVEPVTELCPFELRFLAENGWPHPGARSGEPEGLATDLHAHLAGCPSASTLLALGIAHGVRYPADLLSEAGVHGLDGDVELAGLEPALRTKLEAALSLPFDRQSTFQDMEQTYRLRRPLTKDLRLFPDLLDAVVADYAAMGARHVELSTGDVHRKAWLDAAVAGADRAAGAGVAVRYLLALWRHGDAAVHDELVDRLEVLGRCGPLVGIDFVGHETNSTHAFAAQLSRVADWADRHRPGFVIRVHAGENPAFPENVRVAVEAVAGRDVVLRIGHGLHGVDDTTLDQLRAAGAFVEFNITSNLTLNNIQGSGEVPLRRTLAAGVQCVLGTDGYGLYGTTLAHEVRAARVGGLTDDELAALAAAEAAYLARRAAADAPFAAPFVVPPDPAPPPRAAAPPSFDGAALRRRLGALAIDVIDEHGVEALLRGRRVLSIAGAWAGAWDALDDADRGRITGVLDELLPRLPADRVVLVTGGTRHGVEGEVHRRTRPLGLTVLATIVEATPVDALGPGPTHATVVAEQPHEKAARLYELVLDNDGLAVFLGGGNVVHDELQAAANLRLRYLALTGVAGASSEHAAKHPNRAFSTAGDVLDRLDDVTFFRDAHSPFWHVGPNPTVDLVAVRPRAAGRGGGREVLLVRRDDDAPAEPGQWALPGGFVHTDAPRGEPFLAGAETATAAVMREVREETSLDLAALAGQLVAIGDFEGGGRDERDTPSAWSRTSLFALELDEAHARLPIAGGDDAQDARWFPTDELPRRLAFDHAELLARALAALTIRS